MNACDNCVHPCKTKEGWCAAYTTPEEAQRIREHIEQHRLDVISERERRYEAKTDAAIGVQRSA